MTTHQPPRGTGRSWTVVVPGDRVGPSAWLSTNGRGHWRIRAARSRFWRSAAQLAVRGAQVPHLERAHVVAHLHFADDRRRDVGNYAATVKPVIDGLVDAGVLPDDDDEHLLGPDLRRGPITPPHHVARITLTITELEAPRA